MIFSRRSQNKLNLKQLAQQSRTVENFLQKVLKIIAKEFSANVASVYLWNERDRMLVLTATHGLRLSSKHKVKLRLGQGVVGHAMEIMSPMILARASENAMFEAIDHIGEKLYDAYMIVPVELSGERMGAMVLQRSPKHPFVADQLQVFKEIALATIQHLSSAGLFISLHEGESGAEDLAFSERVDFAPVTMSAGEIFTGKKASKTEKSIVAGKSVIRQQHITLTNFEELTGGRKFSRHDFELALKTTAKQISRLQTSLSEHLSEWAQNIFVGHLLILKDEAYVGRIRQRIDTGLSPPLAISMVTRTYMRFFARSSMASIREKTLDVKDLGVRLLSNLIAGKERQSMDEKLKGKIFVTRDLFLSELMFLCYEGVSGVIQVSPINVLTSHMALIASSLKLPFMIVPDEKILSIRPGERILMELTKDRVHVRPANKLLRELIAAEKAQVLVQRKQGMTHTRPTETRDHVRIKVLANINLLAETKGLLDLGTDGIGLYRSEFPFMVRNTFPSENEQYSLYKRIIHSAGDKEVTIRTLDVGGDKILPYVSDHEDETNSILGLRAIRFMLKYREIFITQLKAILRAAHGRKIKILLPLISSLEEVREVKTILIEARRRLDHGGDPYTSEYQLGIMVEVPSVVWIMDDLAQEVDFFSIGTNDLIQYLLAVDRNNDLVSSFYSHYHPSVLRMVKAVATAAIRNNIECTLCGQMAEDPKILPFLLGVGLRRFSVSLPRLSETRERIRECSLVDAEIIADQLLNSKGSEETKAILRENESVTEVNSEDSMGDPARMSPTSVPG